MGYRKINFVTNFSPFTIDDVTMVTGGSLHLHTFYITPMIEGRFKISDRISIGCGIGAQIPILYTGNMDLENNTNGANSNTSDVLSVDSVLPMKRIAGIILPRITLFQLVWNLN
jgi:hypothetical protein